MAAKKTTHVTQATGKRKTSVARATLKKGKGKLFINNQDAEEYLTVKLSLFKLEEPFVLSGLKEKFDISINVRGGGQSSQVDAMRQAIARALLEETGDEDLKKKFLEYDRSLLVADTRFKEMKKPNNSHARAKRQKSYR